MSTAIDPVIQSATSPANLSKSDINRFKFSLDLLESIIDEIGRDVVEKKWGHGGGTARAEAFKALSAMSLAQKDTLDRCRHWLFHSINLSTHRLHPPSTAKFMEYEEGLITAAKEVLTGDAIVDRRMKTPADYIRRLVIDFGRNVGFDPNLTFEERLSALAKYLGMGIPQFLASIRHVETLIISGARHQNCALFYGPFDGDAYTRRLTERLSGNVPQALYRFVSANPLRRICIEKLDIPYALLQALPASIESLALLEVELYDPDDIENLSSSVSKTLPWAPLTQDVYLGRLGPRATQYLIDQGSSSPGIFDKVKRCTAVLASSEEDSKPLDRTLFQVILSRSAKTLRNMELKYDQDAHNLSVAPTFVGSAILQIPPFPLLERLSLQIRGDLYEDTEPPDDVVSSFPSQVFAIFHSHLLPCYRNIRHLTLDFGLLQYALGDLDWDDHWSSDLANVWTNAVTAAATKSPGKFDIAAVKDVLEEDAIDISAYAPFIIKDDANAIVLDKTLSNPRLFPYLESVLVEINLLTRYIDSGDVGSFPPEFTRYTSVIQVQEAFWRTRERLGDWTLDGMEANSHENAGGNGRGLGIKDNVYNQHGEREVSRFSLDRIDLSQWA